MKPLALIGGLLSAIAVGVLCHFSGQSSDIAWTSGVVVVCATWWIFEPIPIAVTSLIPLAVFPLTGVLNADQVGQAYGDKLVLLMMGGFMLSTAMERSGAHRRIALSMVALFGGANGGRRLVMGFMAAAAFLSMWISNAAATLVLLPIIAAVVERSNSPRLQACLLLGVAYAASIGGICTPIGTPPNLLFFENYVKAGGDEPTFRQWMTWALPVALIMLPIAAIWLTRGLQREEGLELPEVGSWRARKFAR